MKKTRKQNILLVALFSTLLSCGGGGGGGGGSTSSAPAPTTPVPTTPATPTVESALDLNGHIKWNDTTFSYSSANPHNKTSSVTQTGSGVTIGVLDMGFATTDSDLQNIMTSEFGTRLEKITTYGKPTSDQHHGITVAQVAGSSASGTAKGVRIIGVDITKETIKDGKSSLHPDPSLAAYNYLYTTKGVRIFNQSFGVESLVTTFDKSSAKYQINNANTEDILGFYQTAVNNGALFIWAAGNDNSKTDPSLEGGLPYIYSELEKGWINVVGLAKDSPTNPGSTNWEDLQRLNGAGVAKNWTVTAVSGITVQSKDKGVRGTYVMNGSSFAAPMVTGTAALLKQKYPWMTGDLIRQTILSTATDIGKKGVDEDFGWGLLNIGKALNGPALFDKRLALGDNVVADVTAGTYTFSNNISGDAGFIKNGTGTLKFTGNLTYTGNTTINNGTLVIKGVAYNSSSTRIVKGNLVAAADVNIQNDVQNENGNFEVEGSNVTVGGNYTASENATTTLNSNASVHVKGKVALGGSTIELKSEKDGVAQYVTAKGTEAKITSDNKIEAKTSLNWPPNLGHS